MTGEVEQVRRTPADARVDRLAVGLDRAERRPLRRVLHGRMTDGRGNDVVVHFVEQCGFEARKEFYFEEADKDALLMVCEREAFEEALLTGSPATTGRAPTDD